MVFAADAQVEGLRGVDQPAIRGDIAHRVDPLSNGCPELIERLGAGKQAPDADDGDRVVRFNRWIDRHHSARLGRAWAGGANRLRRNAWLSEESMTHSKASSRAMS